jgi:hypothetical protein
VTVDVTFKGYNVTLTLRGDAGADVLPKLETALGWLAERGATPTGNGRPGQEPEGEPDPSICPIHHVQMQRREKQGDVWYSHKAIDPETGAEYWCRGKAEN